jgi:hypothetical protein
MREVKEQVKLHNLRLEHVTIRSELRYLIGAQVVRLKYRVFGGKPVWWENSFPYHHRHSAWQRTELRRVYGDTGMMETDWATGAYGDQGWRRWTE